MAKRKYGLCEKKINKRIKEGRGQGQKNDYIPWIKIQDLSSKGRSSRRKGVKCNRVHQFLSDLEAKFFYYLEWLDYVVDIREQYPIINRDATIKISEEKGIKYPKDPHTGTPIVMTTDFVITIIDSNNKQKDIVRTAKYAEDLEDKRVIEKLYIEEEYYKSRGIDWGIITEKEIPDILVENVKWAYKAYNIEDISTELLTKELLIFYKYQLISYLNDKSNDNKTILGILNFLDSKYNTAPGTFLYLFRHCIINKIIRIDMNKKINLHGYLKDVLIRGD